MFDTGVNSEPEINDILLCNIDGELKVKRFVVKQDQPVLISDNKAKYHPIQLDEESNFAIIGKMVKMKG